MYETGYIGALWTFPLKTVVFLNIMSSRLPVQVPGNPHSRQAPVSLIYNGVGRRAHPLLAIILCVASGPFFSCIQLEDLRNDLVLRRWRAIRVIDVQKPTW